MVYYCPSVRTLVQSNFFQRFVNVAGARPLNPTVRERDARGPQQDDRQRSHERVGQSL